jgi:phosphopantothenoylcysteine decarboxylase / phosphopantothenate---cysteine ligase
MAALKILVTAGPTREPIDPVRFISNRSSGKMGFAIAEAAQKLKHKVTLIYGPVFIEPPKNVHLIKIETAREMHQAVLREAKKHSIIIMTAAVADYEPMKMASQKIKKTSSQLVLRLRKTPDILHELGKRKTKKQFLVGFAAETTDLLKNAQSKLIKKNLDWIIANKVGKAIGFESDYNAVTILKRNDKVLYRLKGTKKSLGVQIIKRIIQDTRK